MLTNYFFLIYQKMIFVLMLIYVFFLIRKWTLNKQKTLNDLMGSLGYYYLFSSSYNLHVIHCVKLSRSF